MIKVEELARISARVLLIGAVIFIGLSFIGFSKDNLIGLTSFLDGLVCMVSAIWFERFAKEMKRELQQRMDGDER